ncbi:TM2 domain-containing protein [Hymenobacter sp. BT175]|uniref:TM2 domain-containing protein n=1 Tax=Hymenobacter translucens TaxID=2886507 RepID=UPI001D0EDA2B|nr:TM2 domain-containing protein [Hymenobacter translucens]MCC2546885.1 TM2 domain-containing protein [Hymenobacter translucens]
MESKPPRPKKTKKAKGEVKKLPVTPPQSSKSQIVALVLAAVFLTGMLGVSRFYLGYTGRGLLYLGLCLFSFATFFFTFGLGGIGYLIALTLTIIDAVHIFRGDLKPKGREYTVKLK